MIWDLSIRIFHWLFAVTIIAAYITGENGALIWHERLGVTAVGLLTYRLIWGIWGPKHTRFSNMLPSIQALMNYIVGIFKRMPPLYIGHNPLGALSVFAFILVTLALSLTGLFTMDDIIYEAPLAYLVPDWSHEITEIHESLHGIVLPLIGLHIAAIAIHQFVFKERLLQRMVFGIDEKEMLQSASAKQPAPTMMSEIETEAEAEAEAEAEPNKAVSVKEDDVQFIGIMLLGSCISLSWFILLVLN
ncbi:cytochrome b/b6 domain-containing protein [Alphaproteobacteria bacterium]|nr:cytochrome b/b6 domain-containing protein [Alphaproteobacteria bacterium]